MQKFSKNNSIFFLIIILAASLRLYGLNWDQNQHLHPDERAIVMFTTPLEFPKTITEFLSPQSTWNPHFFAYGSFPIYLLKIVGYMSSMADPVFATYDKINLLGRGLSAIFDIGTLIVLFFLAKKLFNKSVGLLAAFFYAISVLPIQLSHFYAVDTVLTCFILLTLYILILFYEKPTYKKGGLIGIFFGLSIATKISAILIVLPIGLALCIDFLLVFLKTPHRISLWAHHIPLVVKRLLKEGLFILFVTFITFVIFEPYAVIDFTTFMQHNLQQQKMTHDAFTFPYTLQYVGKIPYLYEIQNIFIWGQGPLLAFLSFCGILLGTYQALKKYHQKRIGISQEPWAQEIILLTFFWTYFFVVGGFAIGFMRYMLPLYPILCLFAAVTLYHLLSSRTRFGIFFMIIGILLLIWPIMFLHIYTKPNTRIQATDWINQNIPYGSTIATEHWDDGLPLETQSNYKVLELPMYDLESSRKWEGINQVVLHTEYIIIASNRLYTPLQKMTNCSQLPEGRCYTQTALYYQKLFDGSLGFTKVAEFSIYPQLPFTNFTLPDDHADESFTVYDHPKIMIFKRER